MIETSRGLPNTCSACGTRIEKDGTWFAENNDRARSGGGLCRDCAGGNPTGKKDGGKRGKPGQEPDQESPTDQRKADNSGKDDAENDPQADKKPEG